MSLISTGSILLDSTFNYFEIRWVMSAHRRSMRTNGECRAKYAGTELAKFQFYSRSQEKNQQGELGQTELIWID
jgi:hypothetical protein